MNTASIRTDEFCHRLEDYAVDVLRLCYSYLGNRADAEDAMQETFLKAWRHRDQYEGRGSGNPKSWLLKIAANTCRDVLRKPWHQRIDHSVDIDTLICKCAAPQEDRDLLLGITMLPPMYKNVVLLRYYQGMTLREIARQLHYSESCVIRRLNHAYGLLRQE